MRGNTGIPYGHRWAEANRFPFFRPVSIFNGAENRRVFHRFKPRAFHPPLVRLILPFSETIAREEGENSYARRLQLLAIFRKRFESLCEGKIRKSDENFDPARTHECMSRSLSLLCRDNSRDFPRVVIFHAVSPSVILFLCSEKEFREWVELSTMFHSALFAWKEIWLGERRGRGRWKLGRNLEEHSFDYIEWDILESEIMLIRC